MVTCSRCFTRGTLLPQRLGELFEDFEEQRPGPEGASQEIVAERGYHFHYRPLEPRCPGCGQSLPEVAPGYDGLVVCSACGRQTTTFPAPAWLQRWAPSAVQFYAADCDEAPAAGSVVNAPQGQSVALSCPSCGAALRVGPERARLAPCEYCHTDVYLADEVWARLHPAQAIRSWYVRFEGVPRRQADAQQRVRDRAEEQVALPAPGGSSAFASIVGAAAMVGIAVAAVVLFVSVRAAVDFAGLDWGSETGGVVATVFLVAALGVWVYLTDIRPRSKSSEKMRALAEKYGLRLEDDCARGVLQGADVTLEPLDHNAVQASLRRCRAWGLSSAPPGNPPTALSDSPPGIRRSTASFPFATRAPRWSTV